MNANIFYQCGEQNAIPIDLLTKEKFNATLSTLSTFEVNYLALQQFKGELGNWALIPDQEGKPLKGYLGAGDDQELQALAFGATELPPGCYAVRQSLPHSALVTW